MEIRLSFLLVLSLSVVSTYRCSNRLYKGQRLKFGEHLCSRSISYRMLLNETGSFIINETYPRTNFLTPPPSILFATTDPKLVPKHLEFTDSGDLVAVASDGSIYWRANVTGGEFVELQNNGIAVIFAMNASGPQVLWKSLSMYSLRLIGATGRGRLEVFYNNSWGGISTNGFTEVDANVSCRTLGYQSGTVITNSYGNSTGRVWLSNVMCRGKEYTLQDCAFGSAGTPWGSSTWASLANVAVQCNGNWTKEVMLPSGHVCTNRLYVGQTLALEDCLCAGPNGEYVLRFTNQHGDTVIRLEYNGQFKWMLGMAANTPSAVQLRLDNDGVLRFIGNGTGLPYNIYNQTTANADYLELQDNGVLLVAALNGSTGWKKALNDFCYEVRHWFTLLIKTEPDMHVTSSSSSSLLTCLSSCANNPTCLTVEHSENYESVASSCPTSSSCCSAGTPCCTQKDVGPWFPFLQRDLYEKKSNCSSGLACYNYYNGTILIDWDMTTPSNTFPACVSDCDANPLCTSILVRNPGLSNQICSLKYKFRNDSWINAPTESYFKIPCNNSVTGNQSVTLLPASACKIELQAGDYLLPGEKLCSLNNQHAVIVGRDGQISLDRFVWNSGSAGGRTAYLQFLSTNQLVMRMDDDSIKWQIGDRNGSSATTGRLIVSNDGQLQILDSVGNLIWDNFGGLALSVRFVVGISQQAALNLLDANNATCAQRASLVVLSLYGVNQSTNLSVSLSGSNLQCGTSSFSVSILRETGGVDLMDPQWRYKSCDLLVSAAGFCNYICNCDIVRCATVAVSPNSCSGVPSNLCDILIY